MSDQEQRELCAEVETERVPVGGEDEDDEVVRSEEKGTPSTFDVTPLLATTLRYRTNPSSRHRPRPAPPHKPSANH